MLAGGVARDHHGGWLTERLVQIGDEIVDTRGRLPGWLSETAFAMDVTAMFPIYDALQLLVVQIWRLLAVVVAHEGIQRLVLIDVAQLLVRVPSGTDGAVGLRREICRFNASPIVPQLIDKIGGDRYFILPIRRMDAQLGRTQRHGIVQLRRLFSIIIAAASRLLISVGRVVVLLRRLVILSRMDLRILELVDVLEAGTLLALLLVRFVELAVEELGVSSALANVNIAVSRHFVFELLLAASAH